MSERERAFPEFYRGYLAGHCHAANRALHLLAKLAVIVLVAFGWAGGDANPILFAPLIHLALCWTGHAVFEANRPVAWDDPSSSLVGSFFLAAAGGFASGNVRPYWSFLADLKMCGEIVRRGRL